MKKNLSLILAATDKTMEQAISTGIKTAFMIYRIGRDAHLYRADVPFLPQGGIMILDTCDKPTLDTQSRLKDEIISECSYRSFSGIVLNFKECDSLFAFQLLAQLSFPLFERGIRLYVPEWLYRKNQNSKVIISTALYSGSLQSRLSSAANKYGAENIAIEIERCRKDLVPPAKNGIGTDLTHKELESLFSQKSSSAFFSGDLCAYYFSYEKSGKSHLVIYDNSSSIRQKKALAESFGIGEAFLYYPDIMDILPAIIGKQYP